MIIIAVGWLFGIFAEKGHPFQKAKRLPMKLIFLGQ
jgi:hypothetical protein